MPGNSKVKKIAQVVIIMSMSVLLICCKGSIWELFENYEPIILYSCSLVTEAVRKEDFNKKFERVVFIRNLPSIGEDSSASNDTIVVKSRIGTYTYEKSFKSFVHLGFKHFSVLLGKNSDVDREDKKEDILVVPFEIPDREDWIKKLEEVKDMEPIENEAEKIESTFNIIMETISISITNKYVHSMDRSRMDMGEKVIYLYNLLDRCIYSRPDSLESVLKSKFVYNIPTKRILLKKRYDYQSLLYKLPNCKKEVNSILKEKKHSK